MAEVTDVMGNLKYQIHVFYDRLLYKSTFTWKNVVEWRHFLPLRLIWRIWFVGMCRTLLKA